ncbi:MAG: Na+/H+ antiporter NhaC [Firmicutes bacterium]|nr:Na+/H+ antiporter NhaC [Bacillota bacterium]
MENNLEKKTPRKAKAWEGILIIGVMLVTMVYFSGINGQDPHIPIFLTIVTEIIIACLAGWKFADAMSGFFESVSRCLEAILILLSVGMLVGSMVWAGTIPSIVYYGLNWLTPTSFLPISGIILGIVSLSTGSSWTAIGTVGIAFMAIGEGLGINPAITAGLCISGGYFGDKLSPLSDSTNLAATAAETNLFRHVSSMITTTLPSFLIALVIWFFIGLGSSGNYDTSLVDGVQETLMASYKLISPVLLLPVVVIIIACIMKVPALVGMMSGVATALLLALIFQGASLNDCVTALHYGFEIETGNAICDELLNRGGLDSMLWTVSLIILAVGFGGIYQKCGYVEALLGWIIHRIKTPTQLVAAVLVTGFFGDFLLSDQYLAILVPGTMYKEKCDELGLDRSFLSRSLEDLGTLWSPLCPWNACGVYCSSTLGMGVLAYGPYCFMALINPIVALVLTKLGIGVRYADGTTARSRKKAAA